MCALRYPKDLGQVKPILVVLMHIPNQNVLVNEPK